MQIPSLPLSTGTVLYPHGRAKEVVVWPSSLHVFCRLGKGIWPCPQRYPVRIIEGVYHIGYSSCCVRRPSPCRTKTRAVFSSVFIKGNTLPVGIGLSQGCPLSPILLVTFIARVSRSSRVRRIFRLKTSEICVCPLQVMWYPVLTGQESPTCL